MSVYQYFSENKTITITTIGGCYIEFGLYFDAQITLCSTISEILILIDINGQFMSFTLLFYSIVFIFAGILYLIVNSQQWAGFTATFMS